MITLYTLTSSIRLTNHIFSKISILFTNVLPQATLSRHHLMINLPTVYRFRFNIQYIHIADGKMPLILTHTYYNMIQCHQTIATSKIFTKENDFLSSLNLIYIMQLCRMFIRSYGHKKYNSIYISCIQSMLILTTFLGRPPEEPPLALLSLLALPLPSRAKPNGRMLPNPVKQKYRRDHLVEF